MSAPTLLSGLAEVADRYDAVLCDVWGVIHNGRESFPEACEALVRFQREHGPVVLISNAPRPADAVVAQLDSLGVPRAAWSGFVTSGDATRAALRERAPGPVWSIGPERDRPLYDGLGLDVSGPEDAAFICCTGLEDDEREGPDDYRERLVEPARRGLVMICANPDRVVERGDRLIYCAGAIADVYQSLGAPVVMPGKPYAPIYDLARTEALRLAGHAPARILAIGDGIATDVKGANTQDLDCLFIARGIHAADLPEGFGPSDVEVVLARAGGHAAYATPQLRW